MRTGVTLLKKTTVIACLAVGLLIMFVAFYVLILEIQFVRRAVKFNASVVEVRRDLVSKGKGSIMAYFPVVEVRDGTGKQFRIPVNTYDKEPIYRVADKMDVLCTLSGSLECKKNTFADKWGDFFVDLIVSFLFLLVPLLYFWRIPAERSSLGVNKDY